MALGIESPSSVPPDVPCRLDRARLQLLPSRAVIAATRRARVRHQRRQAPQLSHGNDAAVARGFDVVEPTTVLLLLVVREGIGVDHLHDTAACRRSQATQRADIGANQLSVGG